jgi:hypothetical protein
MRLCARQVCATADAAVPVRAAARRVTPVEVLPGHTVCNLCGCYLLLLLLLLLQLWSAVRLHGSQTPASADATALHPASTPASRVTPVEVVRQHVAVSVAPAGCTALGHACAVLNGIIQRAHVLVLAQHLLRVAPALLEGAVCPRVPVLRGLLSSHACRNNPGSSGSSNRAEAS